MKEDSSDFRTWARRAEMDWKAIPLLSQAAEPQWENAAFHAQQCAEKYLKAFLISKNWQIKKIHDLTELLADCVEHDGKLGALAPDCALLTPFVMSGRYPGPRSWTTSECETAFAAAGRIRTEILKRLPFVIPLPPNA
jgi:HEPN domain-containing protein